MTIYRVKASNGITVLIEATTQNQAVQRAQSPLIIRQFSLMLQQSLGHVISVEPLRGPQHQIKSLVFDDAFFNNQQ